MKRNSIISLAIIATIVAGCAKKQEAVDDAAIHRLDRVVASGVVEGDSAAIGSYMRFMDMPLDSFRVSPAFNIFYNDVERHLGDLSDAEHRLGIVNKNIVDIGIAAPHYFGIISPYRQQLILNGDSVFIALNHYLGVDYPGYDWMPQFIRQQKRLERLPIDVAEALITSNNPYQPERESTALNRMIYEGALSEAVIQTVGDCDIQTLLGWTDDQMNYVKQNESEIWRQMISQDLLYSTDPVVADRLVMPSPTSSVISPDVPGRIGRYFGYRIVKSWMEKNPGGEDLKSLLQPGFYNDNAVLINSKVSF